MTLGIILGYLLVVLLIGAWSSRRLAATGEDFFVAGRTIGPFVLLMTLFGTHMTSFALLGASAESYRVGIGVFALMASSSALMVPIVFFFVGARVWAVGSRLGLLTQVQFVRARWGSDAVGLLLFVVLVLLLLPYLLIGVMGGGITLQQITDGAAPSWLGSLLISGVVIGYVTSGGLRGTAWVNTFQTTMFMVLGAVTAILIVTRLGGVGAALDRVAESRPELLVRGDAVQPLRLLTYSLIPLSVGTFPHIFSHWLSARTASTFKAPIVLYPVCIAVVWIPSVLLGVFGNIDFPGLEGPASNSVLVQMITLYAPDLLVGLLGAGVFAAIMSSLDSQSLSLGAMFTQDIVRHYRWGGELSDSRQILLGRLFVVGVVTAVFLLSLVAERSIFALSVWSFTGFASLLPVVVAALYWRRSTAAGAAAAIVTVIVLWIWFFARGFGQPDYSVGGAGVMPVAVIFAGSIAAMVLGSLFSKPPGPERVARFHP